MLLEKNVPNSELQVDYLNLVRYSYYFLKPFRFPLLV